MTRKSVGPRIDEASEERRPMSLPEIIEKAADEAGELYPNHLNKRSSRRAAEMDYHEMYEELTLKYIIECRACGGVGKIPGTWDIAPCRVCLGSGKEAVSASDMIIETVMLDGLRALVIHRGYYEFEFPDFKELEV